MTITTNALLSELTLKAIANELQLGSDRGGEYFVVRVATILEAHVDSLLDIFFSYYWQPSSSLQSHAAQQARLAMHQSWPARKDWLKEAFGISLAGTTQDHDLGVLIDLRNALVHGAGSLTPLQSRTLSVRLTLEKSIRQILEANLAGDRIVASSGTVAAVTSVSRNYVLSLDSLLCDAPRPILTAKEGSLGPLISM